MSRPVKEFALLGQNQTTGVTMERHKLCATDHGEAMPEVSNWRWTS